MKFRTLTLATASLLAAAAPASLNAAKPVLGTWGYDQTAMNSSVKPGDDFWAYVNGNWANRTQIPADRASVGSFINLAEGAERDVRQIAEGFTNAPKRDLLGQQIGDYYSSFLDEARIEQLGTAPLKPYLSKIEAAKTRDQLVRLFMTPGYANPIGIGINPNPKDPTHYSVSATQSTLGLPNRDYYLSDSPKMAAYRAAYRDYIVKIEKLAGLGGGEAVADRIIALETALSQAQWSAADRRDIDKTYNPMSRAQVAALAPQFNWDVSLAQRGLGNATQVIVREPSAIAGAGKILAETPLSTWREWLAFRFVSDHADVLPKAISDANFEFYSKTLTGVEQQRDRWKRAVAATNGALGEGVGSIYAKTHFPAESERQMTELIANLRQAYQERISSNSWMDEATRKAALEKLAAFDPRIGHPVKYIDYSPLKVVKGDALGNDLRAADFRWQLQLKRYPKPVDRTLWGMTPQTVNAYNGGLENKIVFPAGILQAPYFDPKADAAVNYGSIGSIIGHEITHGFDDQGRKIDASGALKDWWTAEDAKRFEAQSETFGAQYAKYEAAPGAFVNPKLTMGENLADLAGLQIAYDAYHRSLGGKPAPVIDGLTGDQRFFLGFAQGWRSKERDDAIKSQVASDPHTPSRFRVIGPVRNLDAWYAAFGIGPGSKFYIAPEQRVRIW